jgi:hypothetical protein
MSNHYGNYRLSCQFTCKVEIQIYEQNDKREFYCQSIAYAMEWTTVLLVNCERFRRTHTHAINILWLKFLIENGFPISFTTSQFTNEWENEVRNLVLYTLSFFLVATMSPDEDQTMVDSIIVAIFEKWKVFLAQTKGENFFFSKNSNSNYVKWIEPSIIIIITITV